MSFKLLTSLRLHLKLKLLLSVAIVVGHAQWTNSQHTCKGSVLVYIKDHHRCLNGTHRVSLAQGNVEGYIITAHSQQSENDWTAQTSTPYTRFKQMQSGKARCTVRRACLGPKKLHTENSSHFRLHMGLYCTSYQDTHRYWVAIQ